MYNVLYCLRIISHTRIKSLAPPMIPRILRGKLAVFGLMLNEYIDLFVYTLLNEYADDSDEIDWGDNNVSRLKIKKLLHTQVEQSIRWIWIVW